LTHLVDFYTHFTLRQWTGRVDRAHIIFSHDDWESLGAGRRAQGAATPLPPRWRRSWVCGVHCKRV